MTIRKGEIGAPGPSSTPPANARGRRAAPGATGPARARPSAADAEPASQTPPPAADVTASAAVARVVKLGYDVIAENIQQSRQAAERFSKGKYSLREAPADLGTAAQRMLHLARELSTATFDICEQVLKDVTPQRPPNDQDHRTPAPPHTASPPPTDTGKMRLTVQFEGAPGAISHVASLDRPRRPAAPTDVVAQPLAPSDGGGEPIAGVIFKTDVSIEGLVALVSVPAGQRPGVYSGLVRVRGDAIPLGVITIEIPE
jgi:hypothetical protein